MSEIEKTLAEVHVLHPLIGLYDESGETVAVKCACGAFSTDVLGAGLEGRHYTHVAAEQAKALAALVSVKPLPGRTEAEVLSAAADELSLVLDKLPLQGRHVRARWAESWLRDHSARRRAVKAAEATDD